MRMSTQALGLAASIRALCQYAQTGVGPPQMARHMAKAAAAGKPVAAANSHAAGAPLSQSESSDPSTSGRSLILPVGVTAAHLSPSHFGQYFRLHDKLVPEAYKPFHQSFLPTRDPGSEHKGGCQALQKEVALSGKACLMHRPATQALFGMLEGPQQRVYMDGPSGSGKSMALYSLVERARGTGWIVMYIPSALSLVRGGFFQRRQGSSEPLFDTIVSAQRIIKSVHDAHAQQLAQIQAPSSSSNRSSGDASSTSLADVAKRALATDSDAALAVESCLTIIKGLQQAVVIPTPPPSSEANMQAASPSTTSSATVTSDPTSQSSPSVSSTAPAAAGAAAGSAGSSAAASGSAPSPPPPPPRVLFVLDDYNALYGPTGYGMSAGHEGAVRRTALRVEQLALARGLRLLSQPGLGSAKVVAAGCMGAVLPASATEAVMRSLPEGTDVFRMPRYTQAEVTHALAYYMECGLAPASALPLPPAAASHKASRYAAAAHATAAKVHALTAGNAHELRRLAVKSTMLQANRL